MKKLSICFLLAAAAVSPAMAQRHAKHKATASVSRIEKAPDAVVQAFSQNFQNITGETWHKMASGNWYADVSQDSLHTKIEFAPDGNWIATRTALNVTQLPDTINMAIQGKFPGSTIDQATRIQRADVAPYYRIALSVGGNEKDILANDSGTITE